MPLTDSAQPLPVRLYHRTNPKRSDPLAMYELIDQQVSIKEALLTLDLCLPHRWQHAMAVVQGGNSPLMQALYKEGGTQVG